MADFVRVVFASALLVGILIDSSAEAGIFRRRRRSCRITVSAPALQPLPTIVTGPAEPNALAAAMAEPSLEQAIVTLLRKKGLEPGFIPRGVFAVDEASTMPHEVALKWSLVQSDIEDLLHDYLKLDHRLKLHLIIKTVDATSQPPKSRFVFPRPYDDAITKALVNALPADDEAFDIEIRLVGEFMPVFLNDFKPEFLKNGKPDYFRIQQALLGMLQSKSELVAEARKVNGEIKPVPSVGDVTTGRLRILTQWQDLYREREFQVLWRVSIRLERQTEDSWQLETVIEFGERLRSQSPDQTRKIADTNQLGAFDTSPLDTGAGLHVVKYKPVTSAGRRVLSHGKRTLTG